MPGAMASAATGVLNSAVNKLTTCLGEEYKLASDVRRSIRFMRDELSSMNAALQRLSEVDDDQIDVQTKDWRSKVRELSYDIEDCVDRFMLLGSSKKAKLNFVQTMVSKIKELWEDRKISKEIKELKARVIEEKERRDRYDIGQHLTLVNQTVRLDPRAPTLYEEARDLVGIHGPREEIIGWLESEEKQLKVVSICGTGGQGKTTLAMEVYRKADELFDCRASVSISRIVDIKKLLRDILFQINESEYNRSERWETEQLIRTLREYLMHKRYLIVIDDIWSIPAWEQVQCALPANNNRSRIIITTRSKEVAKSCCIGIDGYMYEAKPLCEDDACTLFFRRIFHSDEDCPQVLRAVATEILRKCGGLPLAIISIAGLLANRSRTVEEWEKIVKSISSAVGTASQIQKMKRILFLSYFDLPLYLKSCLLYLSVFPEDYSIDCRQLIRAWVAEGLIPGQNRESMEQLGESYLNELVNRSMVQPTKIRAGGAVKFCRVHDVIFDFIVSQAVEDNFVVIGNGKDFSGSFSNKMRRLSIQTDFSRGEQMAKALKSASHLRSAHIFNVSDQLDDHIPQFFSSYVLRVLNIQGRWPFGNRNVHVESHTPLKYLVITGRCGELPEQIGKLQHLETLDVKRSGINILPTSIVQLKKLVRLFVPSGVQLPDGIGNMQALEELSTIELGVSSAKTIQELGDLAKLRFLIVFFYYTEACDTEGHKKASISSLSKLLMNLRTLYLAHDSVLATTLISSCLSTPPLQRLYLPYPLSTIPSQMRSFINLVRLRISVQGKVTREGIETLASLPMLASLTVRLRYDGDDILHPRHAIGKQGFQSLLKFSFGGDHEAALEFEPGAMPKVQRLKVELQARCQFMYGKGGLVVGLHNLAVLKYVTASMNCFKAAEDAVKGLEDDIRGTSGTHPNHPILVIRREHTNGYDLSDDQLIE